MICQSRIFYTNLKLEDFYPLLKFLIGTRTIHEKALSFCSTHFLHYRSIWCLPFFSTSSSIYMLRSFSTYLYFYWGRLLWNVCCVFLPSGLLLQLLLEQPTTFESWLVSREFLTLFMLCTLFIGILHSSYDCSFISSTYTVLSLTTSVSWDLALTKITRIFC